MKTLIEISKDVEAVADLMEDVDLSIQVAGGEVTPESQAALAQLDIWFKECVTDRDAKMDNYAALITSLEFRAEGREEEGQRLLRRAATDQRNADFLKDRLKTEMVAWGIKKIETARYKLTVAQNGGKAPLLIDTGVTPERVGPELSRTIPERKELDKDKIRAALEAGRDVPGCQIGERGSHLNVR